MRDFEDATLIRLIAGEQAEALGALYDRYSRLVFSLALHMLDDPAVAEEVTQDVFLRVWKKAGTYRTDQGKVSTWLVSIARNRAIDVLRQRRSRPERNSVGWEELLPGMLPRADGSDPEETAAESIQMQRVRAAIAALPIEQQKALAMAYFEGFSHREIAERLGEPLGTIKTRIRIAMQKLREQLEAERRTAGKI